MGAHQAPAAAFLKPPSSRSGTRHRLALKASSWQPVIVPASELDGGLPGRFGPSSWSGARLPSPRRPFRGRVAGAASPLRLTNASGRRPSLSGNGNDYGVGSGEGDKFICAGIDRRVIPALCVLIPVASKRTEVLAMRVASGAPLG